MIGATIDRLRSVASPPFTSVDGAERLEALGESTAPDHGAAFVVPFDERGEPNTLATGGTSQRVEVYLLVAVVLRAYGDDRGAERVASIDDFRSAIEMALAGWTPDPDSKPYEFVAGRAAPQGNGVTWYVQTWATDRYIRTEE
ncbi:phage tail terminator protein [Ancylobacter lacus]|uniref:phage tail terminator protein n=1 Tax=Ancylobacter lacus TaxID=2579970 RepID=UPI001BD1A494|nr:hypothetical protein [Ancylobacter lacus]MBS7541494.1 hypothetical protein [Ancylobacter lacus]